MSQRENELIALSEQLCPMSWDHGLESLSDAEQVFVTIWELEAEVNNGGFSQYYWNSAGDHAEQAVTSLETIGAPKMADIVRQANAVFLDGPPEDQERRIEFLEALEADATFNRLTEKFCAYPENLSQLLYDYVRANLRGFQGEEG